VLGAVVRDTQTNSTSMRPFMKKLVLALSVVAFCSLSFAQSPSLKKVNLQQEADAAVSQDTADQTVADSPFATTTCKFNFTTGTSNSYLSYCVTVNGNILQIQTPQGQTQSGVAGEGYGICNESPGQNYTDYATSDTGNWKAATLLSSSSSSVKIARSTSDGNWTLTQTITKIPSGSSAASIKVVMALKNNQTVSKVAYLVRYAAVSVDGGVGEYAALLHNSSFAWNYSQSFANPDGLQLQNVGTPPFGFWQAYVEFNAEPNACDFASGSIGQGSIASAIEIAFVMAYVGPVPAGGTKTVTLTYRGM
jgi:hypothetical protein